MPHDVSVPLFLDTDAAAARLGLKPRTLEVWRVRGTGPRFRKHGRSVRYLRADLDAWSDEQMRRSTSEAARG